MYTYMGFLLFFFCTGVLVLIDLPIMYIYTQGRDRFMLESAGASVFQGKKTTTSSPWSSAEEERGNSHTKAAATALVLVTANILRKWQVCM